MCRVKGLGLKCLGFRIGFRIWGLGLRVKGLGFMVEG